jgi:hypothetical protein
MTMISSFYNGQGDGLPRGRVGLFECECGCGQTFFASYKTRYPRYANKTHRARAYRMRTRSRISADLSFARQTNPSIDLWYEAYDTALSKELETMRGRM